jgi:anti-sigma factor RsiW
MSNLLQQLENNEAILLMFLAGELPEDDRVEVEQMLASDPALRAELAELQALHEGINAVLADAEETHSLPRCDAVVRNVSRAMAASQARPIHTKPDSTDTRLSRLRIAWWAYPLAAAALLIIGVFVLSDGHPATLPSDQTVPNQYVDGIDAGAPVTTAQIFPDDLETELISLNSDGAGLFNPTALPDADR